MLARMKTQTTGTLTKISLTVSAKEGQRVMEAIRGLLALTGYQVRRENENNDRLYSSAEVFPEASPGMALRGLRAKEDLTQAELAKRLEVKQHRISEMENGKRPISVEMAKRIGEIFNISYKVFL